LIESDTYCNHCAAKGITMIAQTAVAAAIALLPVSDAFAFGQEGHSIIAEIANRRLSAQATTAIESALGKGHSLAAVASWADDVRDARPTTYNWHFVDLPLASDKYDAIRDCKLDPAKGDCVIAELARLKSALRCAPTTEAKAEALKFTVHFVGDVHQPLHTVLEQRGGNGFEVTSTIKGKTCRPTAGDPNRCVISTNLHQMWDTFLITRFVWNWGSYVDRLEEGWLQSTDAVGATQGSVEEWVEQSHKEARLAWDAVPADKTLNDDYLNEIIPILDRQLGRGGLRLARFLNDAYSSADCAGQ
jgi:hypothetical protein